MSRVSSLEFSFVLFSFCFLCAFLLWSSLDRRTGTVIVSKDKPDRLSQQLAVARAYVDKLQAVVERLEDHPFHRIDGAKPHPDPSVIYDGPTDKVMASLSLNDNQSIDPDFSDWKLQLQHKLNCLAQVPKNVGFYHYHIRKAAGTTIRDMIKASTAMVWRRPLTRGSVVNALGYFETEGVVLNPDLLKFPDLISVISFRDPIKRILSLYWYEHVGWYAGILKKPERCKSLREWTMAWLDGSSVKNALLGKFPSSNYMEIENYYVKALIGYTGNRSLNKDDLEKAKSVLRKFDLIFITEWLGDSTVMDTLNILFPGRSMLSPGHKVHGDERMKERLKPILARDEVGILIALSCMSWLA
jgi:hypothetical protein